MDLKLNINLILLNLLAPLCMWGFSLNNIDAYKEQVINQKLFADPQWLKLGHYHQSSEGHYLSKIQGNFFISPDGNTNPLSELIVTIETFINNPMSQCKYPARFKWLKQKLQIDQESYHCSELASWKKKLGAKEIYIVFAAGDLNNPGSSFGHTFIRLHNPNSSSELLDYGVNFAAYTENDSGALYALKGLFGFYKGSYSMLPYHQKIREYTNLEGRDLWEYKLDLSPDEVDFIIDHLLELDGSYSYYYFSDENCSYQILELLNIVRP
ncbi:MAG: DUF4105 domain-containing protein, partial [Bdellovibrionales bacterium]|nr:DUF4105 domain-containing protein [Bdellovibrionales bacterium]